eukprot:TRINITY_DN11156_c0_g1_i1.p1 TRINITY_DN11156_c0_g1~~TRINITY_DN11156_c0_g1_i1.p1  ORF type:complete len:648 (+),score=84.94 TRINITY_DN11156_c0_g1_i1:1571-3514(+)
MFRIGSGVYPSQATLYILIIASYYVHGQINFTVSGSSETATFVGLEWDTVLEVETNSIKFSLSPELFRSAILPGSPNDPSITIAAGTLPQQLDITATVPSRGPNEKVVNRSVNLRIITDPPPNGDNAHFNVQAPTVITQCTDTLALSTWGWRSRSKLLYRFLYFEGDPSLAVPLSDFQQNTNLTVIAPPLETENAYFFVEAKDTAGTVRSCCQLYYTLKAATSNCATYLQSILQTAPDKLDVAQCSSLPNLVRSQTQHTVTAFEILLQVSQFPFARNLALQRVAHYITKLSTMQQGAIQTMFSLFARSSLPVASLDIYAPLISAAATILRSMPSGLQQVALLTAIHRWLAMIAATVQLREVQSFTSTDRCVTVSVARVAVPKAPNALEVFGWVIPHTTAFSGAIGTARRLLVAYIQFGRNGCNPFHDIYGAVGARSLSLFKEDMGAVRLSGLFDSMVIRVGVPGIQAGFKCAVLNNNTGLFETTTINIDVASGQCLASQLTPIALVSTTTGTASTAPTSKSTHLHGSLIAFLVILGLAILVGIVLTAICLQRTKTVRGRMVPPQDDDDWDAEIVAASTGNLSEFPVDPAPTFAPCSPNLSRRASSVIAFRVVNVDPELDDTLSMTDDVVTKATHLPDTVFTTAKIVQ